MILEVYLATCGKEDIIAVVLQIPMALILLVLVMGLLVTGLLVTRRERQTPTEASKAVLRKFGPQRIKFAHLEIRTLRSLSNESEYFVSDSTGTR